MFEKIGAVVQETAKKKGATLVLDKSGLSNIGLNPVVYSDASYDITEEVQKEIAKGRPANMPAPAAPTAKPAAAAPAADAKKEEPKKEEPKKDAKAAPSSRISQRLGTLQSFRSRRYHSWICSHINAVGTGKGVGQSQIPNRWQVLEAGSADQLEPVAFC
jgi:hypothetical protein